MYRTRKASTKAKADNQPRQPEQGDRMPGLQMRAAFKPGTLNENDRTVDVVFGSDKPCRMYTWEYGPINEELSFDSSHVRMDRLNQGAPVLDNHDNYGSVLDTVVGVVEKAWSDGKKGYAKLRFADSEKGEKVLSLIRSGILQNISVGYAVHKYVRTASTEKGQLDHYRAVDWEPYEVSVVAVPADYDAKVRAMAGLEGEQEIEDEETGEEMAEIQDELEELKEELDRCLAIARKAGKDTTVRAIEQALFGLDANNDILNQRGQELALLKARF